MAPSRVVRIAEDVWDELKSRAEPLEDDTNSVLRRVLGLPDPGSTNLLSEDESRVDKTLNKLVQDPTSEIMLNKLRSLVAEKIGDAPKFEPTTREGRYKFLDRKEKTVAYILYQRRAKRLRSTTGKRLATEADSGDHLWEGEREKGWFNADISLRLFIQDDEESEYAKGAEVLSALWSRPRV